jgi:hypothetical protein
MLACENLLFNLAAIAAGFGLDNNGIPIFI